MKYILVDEKEDFNLVGNWQSFIKQVPKETLKAFYFCTRLSLIINQGVNDLCKIGVLVEEGKAKNEFPTRNIQFTLNQIKKSGRLSKSEVEEVEKKVRDGLAAVQTGSVTHTKKIITEE